jgi:hypothetical protein
LGSVDPINFPPANVGTAGDRTKPGLGTFAELSAYAGGQVVGYFSYPMNTAATRDQLRVSENDGPYADVATPTVYAFDATDEQPVPETNPCTAPPNYDWQKRRREDAVRLDQQGNIFTGLPGASPAIMPGVAITTKYIPIVAEARVSSADRPCQHLKSEKSLTPKPPGKLPGRSGRYLAWLIIDPAAAVYTKEDPAGEMDLAGLSLQRWGWFNRYLLAYLDGGYVPTTEAMVMEGPMGAQVMKKIVRMVPQRLYLPRSPIADEMGMAASARLGAGYDVLAAKRGAPGYSPLCEVVTYDAGMTPVPIDMLPKDGAMIEAMYGTTIRPATGSTPRYVFCLQVR